MPNIDIKKVIEDFWKYAEDNNLELYNEFSLQHELGIYLKERFEKGYKVQFERNIKQLKDGILVKDFYKREIDIIVFKGDKPKTSEEKYAIELKFPQHGQYPVRMVKMIQDIAFMEQVKEMGFTATFAMGVVFKDDKGKRFYESTGREDKVSQDVYQCFRKINNAKPTIKADKKYSANTVGPYSVKKDYQIDWICGVKRTNVSTSVEGVKSKGIEYYLVEC